MGYANPGCSTKMEGGQSDFPYSHDRFLADEGIPLNSPVMTRVRPSSRMYILLFASHGVTGKM